MRFWDASEPILNCCMSMSSEGCQEIEFLGGRASRDRLVASSRRRSGDKWAEKHLWGKLSLDSIVVGKCATHGTRGGARWDRLGDLASHRAVLTTYVTLRASNQFLQHLERNGFSSDVTPSSAYCIQPRGRAPGEPQNHP